MRKLLLGMLFMGFLLTVGQTITVSYDKSGNVVSRLAGLRVLRDSVFVRSLNSQSLLVEIRPNPTKGHLQVLISLENSEEPVLISVYNTAGALLFEKNTFESTTEIDISNQPDGIYTLMVKYQDLVSTSKLIKQ